MIAALAAAGFVLARPSASLAEGTPGEAASAADAAAAEPRTSSPRQATNALHADVLRELKTRLDALAPR